MTEIEKKQRALFVMLAFRHREPAALRIRRGFLVALDAGGAGSHAAVIALSGELPAFATETALAR